MMEGDFAAWRTYLHPQQRAVAYRADLEWPLPARRRRRYRQDRRRFASCRVPRPTPRAPRAAVHVHPESRRGSRGRRPRSSATRRTRPHRRARGRPGGASRRPGRRRATRCDPGRTASRRRSGRTPSARRGPADLAPALTPAFLAGEYRTVVLGMSEQSRDAYLRVKRPVEASGSTVFSERPSGGRGSVRCAVSPRRDAQRSIS